MSVNDRMRPLHRVSLQSHLAITDQASAAVSNQSTNPISRKIMDIGYDPSITRTVDELCEICIDEPTTISARRGTIEASFAMNKQGDML